MTISSIPWTQRWTPGRTKRGRSGNWGTTLFSPVVLLRLCGCTCWVGICGIGVFLIKQGTPFSLVKSEPPSSLLCLCTPPLTSPESHHSMSCTVLPTPRNEAQRIRLPSNPYLPPPLPESPISETIRKMTQQGTLFPQHFGIWRSRKPFSWWQSHAPFHCIPFYT